MAKLWREADDFRAVVEFEERLDCNGAFRAWCVAIVLRVLTVGLARSQGGVAGFG